MTQLQNTKSLFLTNDNVKEHVDSLYATYGIDDKWVVRYLHLSGAFTVKAADLRKYINTGTCNKKLLSTLRRFILDIKTKYGDQIMSEATKESIINALGGGNKVNSGTEHSRHNSVSRDGSKYIIKVEDDIKPTVGGKREDVDWDAYPEISLSVGGDIIPLDEENHDRFINMTLRVLRLSKSEMSYILGMSKSYLSGKTSDCKLSHLASAWLKPQDAERIQELLVRYPGGIPKDVKEMLIKAGKNNNYGESLCELLGPLDSTEKTEYFSYSFPGSKAEIKGRIPDPLSWLDYQGVVASLYSLVPEEERIVAAPSTS